MKKISMFLAMSIIAAIGLHAQETTMLKVKIQAANVRAEPDLNSAIVKQVKLGTLLESRKKIGVWFEIMITDDKGMPISGYINSGVVDVVSTVGTKPAAGAPQQVAVVSPGGAKPAPQPSPPPVAGIPPRRPSAMIFGRYGLFSPNDENFKSIYGSGSVFGGELRLHVTNGFYLSLAGGVFKKTGALTLTKDETTLTIYPIDAMVVYHFLSGGILPYLGVGGAICKYKEENIIGTVDKWGFGFGFCGGVTARWKSLGVDARVKYTSVKIKPLEDEAGLGGLTLSLAAGVVF
ncbi:MAG: SH3 domain-containing protein [Candidatus Aminicenantes bacterium]|nr:SH3 domain-containing protein [Candidatus Aminicenantes bacterium]